jgi:hypothetical protein
LIAAAERYDEAERRDTARVRAAIAAERQRVGWDVGRLSAGGFEAGGGLGFRGD